MKMLIKKYKTWAKHPEKYTTEQILNLIIDDLGRLEKNTQMPDISSQRELLFAFEKWRTSHIINATDEWRYANVDLFLSK